MKNLIFILPLLLFTSCFDKEIIPFNYTPFIADSIAISADDVDENSIYPEIAEYYENLSIVARWYASHPKLIEKSALASPLNYNPILAKLLQIKITGSKGENYSIFDLDKNDMEIFLESWKKIEAAEMSYKFRKNPKDKPIAVFQNRNKTLAGKLSKLKSAGIENEDPFSWPIAVLDNMDATSSEYSENNEYSENDFLETLIANYNLSYSIIQQGPLQLPARTFVNRIKPSIIKGHILLALPGGWTTNNLIVFYPDKQFFDVGHVAVISKDWTELGDSIHNDISFSIGTSLKYDTNFETIGQSWLFKHSMAFVCQVCDVRWKAFNDENSKTITWKRIQTDADNYAIYNETIKYNKTPYCNPAEAFYSKLVVPESFICSSLAWYAVKESTGLKIDDSWGPSVYPIDILLSENIKVIDDTFE